MFHGENGVLGLEGYPKENEEDANLIDPSGDTVKVNEFGAFFDSAECFDMIRSSKIDFTLLGAYEVDSFGNIANFIIPGEKFNGMGGAMELC